MEVSSLFHNNIRVVEENGWTFGKRFSEAQTKALSNHALYRAMEQTTAGLSLEFKTDSTAFSLPLKRISRSLLPNNGDIALDFATLYGRPLDLSEAIEIRINGELLPSFPLRTGKLSVPLPGHESSVKIYLPLHHQIGLGPLEGDGRFQAIERKRKTLLCLGDSIIQGVGIHHPSQSLGALLSESLGCEQINQGVAGSLFNPALIQSVETYSPVEAILVSYGTNDWVIRPSIAEFKAEVYTSLARLRKFHPQTPIVLLTPLWRADIQIPKRMGTFDQMQQTLVTVARSFGKVDVVDGLSHSLRNQYADAYLHPNEIGIAYLAKALHTQLKRYFE